MRLFVGPLAESASSQDVRRFIQAGISHKGWLGLFKNASGQFSCTMMEVPGRNGFDSTYFAIVQIPLPSLARKAITNLNGASINEKTVSVRMFVERNPANDRRQAIPLDKAAGRRKRERRGHAVPRIFRTAKKVVIEPVMGFAREHQD